MKTEQTVSTERAGDEIKAPKPVRRKNYHAGRSHSYGNETRGAREDGFHTTAENPRVVREAEDRSAE